MTVQPRWVSTTFYQIQPLAHVRHAPLLEREVPFPPGLFQIGTPQYILASLLWTAGVINEKCLVTEAFKKWQLPFYDIRQITRIQDFTNLSLVITDKEGKSPVEREEPLAELMRLFAQDACMFRGGIVPHLLGLDYYLKVLDALGIDIVPGSPLYAYLEAITGPPPDVDFLVIWKEHWKNDDVLVNRLAEKYGMPPALFRSMYVREKDPESDDSWLLTGLRGLLDGADCSFDFVVTSEEMKRDHLFLADAWGIDAMPVLYPQMPPRPPSPISGNEDICPLQPLIDRWLRLARIDKPETCDKYAWAMKMVRKTQGYCCMSLSEDEEQEERILLHAILQDPKYDKSKPHRFFSKLLLSKWKSHIDDKHALLQLAINACLSAALVLDAEEITLLWKELVKPECFSQDTSPLFYLMEALISQQKYTFQDAIETIKQLLRESVLFSQPFKPISDLERAFIRIVPVLMRRASHRQKLTTAIQELLKIDSLSEESSSIAWALKLMQYPKVANVGYTLLQEFLESLPPEVRAKDILGLSRTMIPRAPQFALRLLRDATCPLDADEVLQLSSQCHHGDIYAVLRLVQVYLEKRTLLPDFSWLVRALGEVGEFRIACSFLQQIGDKRVQPWEVLSSQALHHVQGGERQALQVWGQGLADLDTDFTILKRIFSFDRPDQLSGLFQRHSGLAKFAEKYSDVLAKEVEQFLGSKEKRKNRLFALPLLEQILKLLDRSCTTEALEQLLQLLQFLHTRKEEIPQEHLHRLAASYPALFQMLHRQNLPALFLEFERERSRFAIAIDETKEFWAQLTWAASRMRSAQTLLRCCPFVAPSSITVDDIESATRSGTLSDSMTFLQFAHANFSPADTLRLLQQARAKFFQAEPCNDRTAFVSLLIQYLMEREDNPEAVREAIQEGIKEAATLDGSVALFRTHHEQCTSCWGVVLEAVALRGTSVQCSDLYTLWQEQYTQAKEVFQPLVAPSLALLSTAGDDRLMAWLSDRTLPPELLLKEAARFLQKRKAATHSCLDTLIGLQARCPTFLPHVDQLLIPYLFRSGQIAHMLHALRRVNHLHRQGVVLNDEPIAAVQVYLRTLPNPGLERKAVDEETAILLCDVENRGLYPQHQLALILGAVIEHMMQQILKKSSIDDIESFLEYVFKRLNVVAGSDLYSNIITCFTGLLTKWKGHSQRYRIARLLIRHSNELYQSMCSLRTQNSFQELIEQLVYFIAPEDCETYYVYRHDLWKFVSSLEAKKIAKKNEQAWERKIAEYSLFLQLQFHEGRLSLAVPQVIENLVAMSGSHGGFRAIMLLDNTLQALVAGKRFDTLNRCFELILGAVAANPYYVLQVGNFPSAMTSPDPQIQFVRKMQHCVFIAAAFDRIIALREKSDHVNVRPLFLCAKSVVKKLCEAPTVADLWRVQILLMSIQEYSYKYGAHDLLYDCYATYFTKLPLGATDVLPLVSFPTLAALKKKYTSFGRFSLEQTLLFETQLDFELKQGLFLTEYPRALIEAADELMKKDSKYKQQYCPAEKSTRFLKAHLGFSRALAESRSACYVLVSHSVEAVALRVYEPFPAEFLGQLERFYESSESAPKYLLERIMRDIFTKALTEFYSGQEHLLVQYEDLFRKFSERLKLAKAPASSSSGCAIS